MLGALAIDAHDGGIAALRDDHCPLHALGARNQGKPRRNELDVCGLPALGLGPSARLGLVAEEVIAIWDGLHEDRLEGRHLHQEWRRQVQAIDATIFRLLGRDCLHGVGRDSGEEACAVDDLGALDDLPIRSLLAVVRFVVVRGVQVGAQRALNASNERGASASRRLGVDHVQRIDTVGAAGLLQLLTVLVLADAAHVSSGASLLRHPLRDADGVLGGTSSNELHVGQLHHLSEKRLVLLLSQNGVSCLQAILVQHCLVDLGRDVQERVAHSQKP